MTLENILAVGTDKNGDFDFAVTATIQDLSYEKMKEFRSMLIVAIGTAEDMWRRRNQEQAAKNSATF